MKVLVHVHAWNAAAFIENTIETILRQTVAVEEILLIDNASTDATAECTFPSNVTLVKSAVNLGTSGAVAKGIEYARARGYDWIWILDADSHPRPDALEHLIGMAQTLGRIDQQPIGVICSSQNVFTLGLLLHGRRLTPGGPRPSSVSENLDYIECDSVIWSGSLINLAVVERAGLPRSGVHGSWEDLSLDYGDIEYCYRIRLAGFRVLVHRYSLIDHPVGNGLHRRILGHDFYSSNHSAFRRYLYFRNLVFFWLHIYHHRNWPMLLVWFGFRLWVTLFRIIALEDERGPKLMACFTGIRDGLLSRMDANFTRASSLKLPTEI